MWKILDEKKIPNKLIKVIKSVNWKSGKTVDWKSVNERNDLNNKKNNVTCIRRKEQAYEGQKCGRCKYNYHKTIFTKNRTLNKEMLYGVKES